MPETDLTDGARVAALVGFFSARPGSWWGCHANSVLHVPCEPYLIIVRNITATNLDIELHLHANREHWNRLEPLLNTRPGSTLPGKIRRFRDNWNQVREDPENAFRLIATLAQAFALLLPEDQPSATP